VTSSLSGLSSCITICDIMIWNSIALAQHGRERTGVSFLGWYLEFCWVRDWYASTGRPSWIMIPHG